MRVSVREITDFLAALREQQTAPSRSESARGRLDVLAWKSSLLDRIAAQTTDAETRSVAAAARADLATARAELAAARAEELASSYEVRTGGRR
ncbi:hypothetical protein J0910_02275 [Nocardiopsis sp. CNT-189]|uniref:hypothetical protein n=1 Tax=Nocardiopsis oceanisediminis TaxID=2816862 RepID=UPI003B360AC8